MRATVDIIIVTWNSREDVRQCLRSLGTLPPEWQTWVVDNASTDGTVEAVRAEFPWVRVIANGENLGFARANNQVIARTDTDYVLLLNPDTELSAGAVSLALHELEQRPRAGLLAVQLRNTDGSLQPSCFRFPSPGLHFFEAAGLHRFLPRRWRARLLLAGYWDHAEARPVDWALGAFLLARRAAIRDVGPVPEEHFLFSEDLEWCYRMGRQGYEVGFTPAIAIVHHGNRSAGQLPSLWRAQQTHRGRYDFCDRNYGRMSMRLVQLADLLGYSLRLWKYRRGRQEVTRETRAIYELMRIGHHTAWLELRRGPRSASEPRGRGTS